jgi:hypothetical protein
MQNFVEVNESTSLLASLTQLMDNDKTVMSCHSGIFEPSINLETGMLWQNTANVPYQLKSLIETGPSLWVTVPTYTGTPGIGDTLAWDEVSGWVVTSAAANTFSGLSDTTITTPTQGQISSYDTTDGWVNSTATALDIAARVYTGPAGSAGDNDYYTKVATFTTSASYSSASLILSYASSNQSDSLSGIISVSINSSATSFVDTVYVSCLAGAAGGASTPDFLIKTDVSSNIATLWMQKHAINQQFYMYEISRNQEAGVAIVYNNSESWVPSYTLGTKENSTATDLEFKGETVWHTGNDNLLLKSDSPHTLDNTFHSTGVLPAELAFDNFSSGGDYPYLKLTAPYNSTTGKASLLTLRTYNDNGSLKDLILDARGSGDAVITVPGEIRATGAITANYSDPRLKTGWENFDNISQKMKEWTVGRHFWTLESGLDPTEKQVGLDASQVREDAPEIVKFAPGDRDMNGNSISGKNYLTIQYDKLSVFNTAAINEHTHELDHLKNRVTDLEEIVRGLTNAR